MHQRSTPSMKNIDDSLVQTLQYTKTLPWICFVHVNMKNLPSQVGWFSKIAENFRTAQTAKARISKFQNEFMNKNENCQDFCPV